MLRYYLCVIFGAMAVIASVNIFAWQMNPLTAAGLVAAYTLGVIAVDAVVAVIVRKLPERLYDPFKKRYNVGKRERRFLDCLKIKKWKDKIPESGKALIGFDKKKIADPGNNEYVLKFMKETCYAEVMHFYSVFLGGLIILACPPALMLRIPLPVACVNAVLQILPVMVQRYNRTRLEILYRRNLKHAGSAKKGEKSAA